MLVRAAADGSTADLTPAAVQRPDPRPRVRRRLVHGGRRRGRVLPFHRRPPVPARPGRGHTRPDHARGPVALRRPAGRSVAATVPGRSRGPLGPGRAAGGDRGRSRSMATARRSCWSAGLTSWRPRACRRTGSRLAWLEWDHPDMPWDATRLRVAPIRDDGTLGEPELAAGGPDESIVQPEWSPDGVPPLRVRPNRLVEPLPPRRRSAARGHRPDGGGVRRSGLDLRAVVVRFHSPDGSIVADRRVGRVATGCHPRPPRRAGRRGRVARTPSSTRCTSGRRRSWRSSARRPSRRCSPGSTPRRWRSRASSVDRARVAIDPATCRPARGDRTSRSADGRVGPRPVLPAANPAFIGPDGERPPLVVLSHGGPTSNASSALDLTKQLLTSRGIAVVDVDYGGSTGYGRAYRRALDGRVGHRRRRRLRGGGPLPRGARRRRSRSAGDRGRQRGRLHDAGGARLPRRVRGRHQPVRRRRPGDAGRATRTSSSRATSIGSSGRTRRRPGLPGALADPLARPDLLPGPGRAGPRRPGRAAGPGRGDRGGPDRQRHPVRLPRLRGRGPRLPWRRRHSSLAGGGARRSSARSSGSSRPTDSSRSRCPAWSPGASITPADPARPPPGPQARPDAARYPADGTSMLGFAP